MVADTVLRCSKCESRAPSLVFELSGPDSGQICRCTDCNSVWVRNTNDCFYDFSGGGVNQDKGLLIQQEDLYFYTSQKFRRLCLDISFNAVRDTLRKYTPKTVLDIGCGAGGYGVSMPELYDHYYGLEPSPIPAGETMHPLETDKITLIHYNPDRPLPIYDNSVDMVTFIASYDHIPDPGTVVKETWAKLKPGGHFMILMTNHGFWAKKLIKIFAKNSSLVHNPEEHFRSHDPESLDAEIKGFLPEAKLEYADANIILVPRLPKILAFLYFSKYLLLSVNYLLKIFCGDVLKNKNLGSVMIVLFKKL